MISTNIMNTENSYGTLAKYLHWLMACLFVLMFICAYIMINLSGEHKFTLYDLHKASGLLLFMLVIIRLIWRKLNPQPKLNKELPRWQQYSANANIFLLYGLMFLMPMSGFLTSTLGGHVITFYHLFDVAPLANDRAASLFFSYAHEYLSYLLIAAFGLHLLAALYHHYVLKDNTVKRMM